MSEKRVVALHLHEALERDFIRDAFTHAKVEIDYVEYEVESIELFASLGPQRHIGLTVKRV